jgi:hypothetical protein
MKTLTTKLNMEQCRNILKDNRWKFRYLFSSGKKNFIKNYGNFIYSTVIEGRNSWAIYFFGMLKDKKGHIEIKGFFFIHPYTVIFTIIIFILFSAAWFMSGFQNELIFFIIAFILITFLGIFSSRKNPSLITAYLKKILQAEEIK